DSLRLLEIVLTPDINGICFFIAGRTWHQSSEIQLGWDHSEFARSLISIPLSGDGEGDSAESSAADLFFARGIGDAQFHGTSRFRLLATLAYHFGYYEAIRILDGS